MHTCRTRLDHCFHQLIGIEISAKTSFRIGNNGPHPVLAIISVYGVDLLTTQQRIVDPFYHIGNRIYRIQ
jgi:hypothetical protein